MKPHLEFQFIHFLEEELSVPHASILVALRHRTDDLSLLPIVLWKYGLVTLDEVSRMFDWLAEKQISPL